MTLILEIAAGIVLGVLALVLLGLLFVAALRAWDALTSRRWVLWTLGVTGVGLYVLWLIDRPK